MGSARISATPVVVLSTSEPPARVSAAPLLVLTDERPPARISAAPLLVLEPMSGEVEAEFTDGEASHPLGWIEVTDRAGDLNVFAEVDLCDRASYYGGYKAPLVLQFSSIQRGLSDRSGQPQHVTFGASLSDTARTFRGLLGATSTKYLTNRPAVVRVIDDDDRRLEGLPRVVANGYVSDYSPEPDLRFRLTASDWLKKKFSRKASSQLAWQPRLSREDFPLLPDASLNKAAQLPYGKVSDEIDGAEVGTDLYPRDTTDPGWLQLGYNHVAAAGIAAGNYCAYVTTITGGVESKAYAFQVGFSLDGSQQPAIYFKTSATPDLYRVYFSDGLDAFEPFVNPLGGTFARYQDFAPAAVPEGPTDPFGNPTDNRYVVIDSVTWGSDYRELVAAGGETGTDHIVPPRGAAPVMYLGTEAIGGHTRSAFLIARGAVKGLPGVFVNGVRVTSFGLAASILAPFHDDYEATCGANYRDINGRRYTILYAVGDVALKAIDGSAPITVNVWGAETNGDTTGDLIVAPAQQLKHFVKNWIAPDTPYQSGAWLGSTFFPAIPDLALVDDESFDAAEAAAAERLEGGYEGAILIGANGEDVGALDAIAHLTLASGGENYFNRRGQLALSLEPVAPVSGVEPLTDVLSIADNTFRITDEVTQNFFNVIPYTHTRDYTGISTTGWFSSDAGETQIADDLSIELYDQELLGPSFAFHALRNTTPQGAATIADILARLSMRYRDPRRRVELTIPLSGLSYELGDVVPVSSVEGISADGWVGHQVRIADHRLGVTEGTVVLGCYDLEPMFGAGVILGDRSTLAASWLTASDADQRYAYLCDRDTGRFSNGDRGKVFR